LTKRGPGKYYSQLEWPPSTPTTSSWWYRDSSPPLKSRWKTDDTGGSRTGRTPAQVPRPLTALRLTRGCDPSLAGPGSGEAGTINLKYKAQSSTSSPGVSRSQKKESNPFREHGAKHSLFCLLKVEVCPTTVFENPISYKFRMLLKIC
jgi:hypothetical protein